MAKDKRKKKYFQGMEHLQQHAAQTPGQLVHEQVSGEADMTAESGYIRRDLRNVVVLMVILILLMVGLTVLDKKSDKLTFFAEKVTPIVIK